MARCKAKTTNGGPCAAHAGASGFCFIHDPAMGRKRAQARKLGGRHRKRGENGTPFPECDVKTAQGLAALLETVLRETWTLEAGISRSRTLGYLAQVQKSVIEVGEIERRLEALEKTMGAKNNGHYQTA